jgi:hypothetical protein
MGTFTAHWPDRTSVKNMVQWIQNARTGGFNDFAQNPYQPQNIHGVPIAVFYGTADYLADPSDVQNLISQLSSVVYTKEVTSPRLVFSPLPLLNLI